MKLLIANRGEIAVRIARTCRDLGVPTVAVVSDADEGALHATACDQAVFIGGRSPGESYLDAAKLLDAAARSGATAVHPGYGFLSEDAGFAQAVLDAGLIWVGPPPSAIAAMGSKTEARRRMIEAGVPVVPGGDTPQDVGLPLLIKASAGGGGRGMRVVRDLADFETERASAEREALSAFGDGTVFLERLVEGARHVEIQVVADTHGAVVHLGARDCSVQRRHQKVVEEAPGAQGTLLDAMGQAAIQAAAAVDYVGAGTVEFLVSPDGEFFFLEMNTRLQVEHPVTEAIHGVDLVAWQLHVAQGGSLPAVPEPNGHAIEVRLYAEDPDNDYAPRTGTVLALRGPEGLRLDTGIQAGSVVGIDYDPMLAKLIAHGATREIARRRLVQGLRDLVLHGVQTNREQLLGILEHPDFVADTIHTGWLADCNLSAPEPDAWAAVAALTCELSTERAMPGIPRGFRNNRVRDNLLNVGDHVVHWLPKGATGIAARVGEQCGRVSWTQTHLRWGADQIRFDALAQPDGWWVHTPNYRGFVERPPAFPDLADQAPEGSLEAPMPGKVLRVQVSPGDAVSAGQVLVVLEAMKMEQRVMAPADGVVREVLVGEGDQVDSGQALVVVT
jgi:propionyl-CoA carboxylase alpha chain